MGAIQDNTQRTGLRILQSTSIHTPIVLIFYEIIETKRRSTQAQLRTNTQGRDTRAPAGSRAESLPPYHPRCSSAARLRCAPPADPPARVATLWSACSSPCWSACPAPRQPKHFHRKRFTNVSRSLLGRNPKRPLQRAISTLNQQATMPSGRLQ